MEHEDLDMETEEDSILWHYLTSNIIFVFLAIWEFLQPCKKLKSQTWNVIYNIMGIVFHI
jgi:hypothetical protein